VSDGIVDYIDGTEATEDQVAKDVAAFLMWTAEPKLVDRKEAGFRNIIWLGIFAVLMYFVNKKVWRPVKGDH
jgi:ubiquinol-cytochrome c reductase cytochrome c1 subunit